MFAVIADVNRPGLRRNEISVMCDRARPSVCRGAERYSGTLVWRALSVGKREKAGPRVLLRLPIAVEGETAERGRAQAKHHVGNTVVVTQ
jgi:hypothetical protein